MTKQEFEHRTENLSQRLHVLNEEIPLNIGDVLYNILLDLRNLVDNVYVEGVEQWHK